MRQLVLPTISVVTVVTASMEENQDKATEVLARSVDNIFSMSSANEQCI